VTTYKTRLKTTHEIFIIIFIFSLLTKLALGLISCPINCTI